MNKEITLRRNWLFILLVALPLVFGPKKCLGAENVNGNEQDVDAITSVSRTMTYQGILTDSDGNPISGESRTITFRLFDSITGGTLLWNQTTPITTDGNGYFSANLGNLSLPFDEDYFLELQIQGEQPMTPRQMMGMSGFAARADTSQYAESSPGGSDGAWIVDGEDIYRIEGTVGIGTSSQTTAKVYIYPDTNSYSPAVYIVTRAIPFQFREYGMEGRGRLWRMPLASGNIRFDVSINGTNFDSYATPLTLTKEGKAQVRNLGIYGDAYNFHEIRHESQTGWLEIDPIGSNGTKFNGSIEVDGTATTGVLEITGGADIAEPFPMSSSDGLLPGSVVIIDEDNPGQLTLSSQPYDRRVAGIISGAGGINPGLTVTQEDMMDGDQNVALSGRVYALATASNGTIKPGDLLTTSDIPGHAMKVTDYDRAHGTVIGKAMSALDKREGLVLVLVNLQ
jgi:hypothetical protein